jgi:Rieske Fe-S protein
VSQKYKFSVQTQETRRQFLLKMLAFGGMMAGVSNLTACGDNATASVAHTRTSSGTTQATVPTPVPTTQAPTPTTTTAPIPQGFADLGPISDFASVGDEPKPINLVDKVPNEAAGFLVKTGNFFLVVSYVCTDAGCGVSISPTVHRYICPCHGSEYAYTGEVIGGPATRPLAQYATKVVNGRLLVSEQPSN